jgi:hypothetical protein
VKKEDKNKTLNGWSLVRQKGKRGICNYNDLHTYSHVSLVFKP